MGHVEITMLLLEAGADAHAKDVEGKDAADRAREQLGVTSRLLGLAPPGFDPFSEKRARYERILRMLTSAERV